MLLIHIIVFFPCPVNTLSGALFAWAAVHSSNLAVLPVARRDFPLFADFDADSIVVAGHNNTAVVVGVDNIVVVVNNSKVAVEPAVDL
jgi:hypothetical protein